MDSCLPATGSKRVFRAQSRAPPPLVIWPPKRHWAIGNANPQAPMRSVIIHYQEIALKGKNRPWFVDRLVRNIRAVTGDLDITEVRVLMGRIELVLGREAQWEQVRDRIALVFGIGNFARAGRAPLDVDAIATEILKDLGPENPATFRVSANRPAQRFPLPPPPT